jgi:hypothetical protein
VVLVKCGVSALLRQVFSGLLLLESPFLDWFEEGLDIQDGRSVERLEVPYANPGVVDREDLHIVQPDGVRPIGGTSAEHSTQGVVAITSRMHDEYIAAGAIKPRQHDDLGAHLEVANPSARFWVEHEPGVRRSFVTLSWGEVAVDERRFDPSDGL